MARLRNPPLVPAPSQRSLPGRSPEGRVECASGSGSESDDPFPSLAQLSKLARARGSVATGTQKEGVGKSNSNSSSSSNSNTAQSRRTRSRRMGKAALDDGTGEGGDADAEGDGARARAAEEGTGSEVRETASTAVVVKRVVKKRVLNTRGANPLLLPLGRGQHEKSTGLREPSLEKRLVKKAAKRGVEQDPRGTSLRVSALEELAVEPSSRVGAARQGILPEMEALAGGDGDGVGSAAGGEMEGGKSGLKMVVERQRVERKQMLVSPKMTPEVLVREDSEGKDESVSDLDGSELKPRVVYGKIAKKKRPEPAIEEDSESNGEKSGSEMDEDGDLSDFVVDDSDTLDEEDSVIEAPPPRSVRRLVRGRRRVTEDEEELELGMGRLNVNDVSDPFVEPMKRDVVSHDRDHSDSDNLPLKASRKESKSNQHSNKIYPEPSSDIEPFTLRYSPSPIKPTVLTNTPPTSPSKSKRLTSPTKAPRIPSTPHQITTDSFWAQDLINDWNDTHSPPKPKLSKPLFSHHPNPPAQPNPAAQKAALKAFSLTKQALATSFLAELDAEIAHGQIAALSAGTGGVQLVWSNKLSTTAGRANWKRETIRAAASSGSGAKPITYRHHAQIELSLKVITSEDRLLNVLAHEFCHLTTFMLSGVKTNPHGKEFKSWAGKVSAVFGGRGVEVTTKHGYEIAFKYVWECELCGAAYKRHSKSVDVKRHRCGACKGALVQILPVPKVGKGGEGKGLGEYQLFVKEQMGVVRRENPDSPQKEIMGLVGRKYQEHKARKLEENVVDGTEESTPVTDVVGDVVGDVARKLDFLDLTSP